MGVLLAYGEGSPSGTIGAAEEYRTLALVVERDSVTLDAVAPTIILPTASVFERMGVATYCTYDGATKVDNYRQQVWRVAASPAPPVGSTCAAASDSPSADRPACDDWRAQILFAGARLWAERIIVQQTETCEPRGGRWTVSDSVRSMPGSVPMSLGTIFGEPAARDKFAGAMSKGHAELVKEGFNCPVPSANAYDLSSWSISHRRGAWRPAATVSEFAFYGECQLSHEMELSVPDTLTGDTPDRGLWSTLSPAIPDLDDYFMSPNGEVLIVVTGKRFEAKLQLYSMKGGAVGRRLWETPWGAQNEVVMMRWSAGATAREWWKAVAGFATR